LSPARPHSVAEGSRPRALPAVRPAGMSFLTVMVALVGIFASILNAQFGAGTFLFAAVALRCLEHPDAVKRTLLPFFVGGKVVLYAVKLIVTN
jgi:hypothetical protein